MKLSLVVLILSLITLRALAQSALVKASIDSPPILSFAEAYERIQKRNLNVGSQQLAVEIARAKKLANVGAFTPSLSLVASDAHDGTYNRQVGIPEDTRSVALAVGANLFKSGTDFAALKAANRDLEASEEALADQRLKAEDDAATALITFISRSRERELISQIVELKQESVKIARERFTHGLLAAQEVDKTQIDLDNAQAQLIDADVSLASARAEVSARLGTEFGPSQNVNLEWPWKTEIMSGPRFDVSAFRLESRPDYRAALRTLEAQDWRRHAARASLLPSLDFSASYGSYDLSQNDRRDWSAMLRLTIPIFENFSGWSASRIQQLTTQQADFNREAIVRAAGAEIDSLTVGFRAARDSAVAREKTSKLTSRLFTDNLQRFRLGRASVNELSVDQARLLDAQILEVRGWASAHLNFVHLCHALGHSVSAGGTCRSL